MNISKEYVQRLYTGLSEEQKREKDVVVRHEFFHNPSTRHGRISAADLLHTNLFSRERLSNCLRRACEIRKNPAKWDHFIADPETCAPFEVGATTDYDRLCVFGLWVANDLGQFHLDPQSAFMEPLGPSKAERDGSVVYKYGRVIHGDVDLSIMEKWNALDRPPVKQIPQHLMEKKLVSLRNRITIFVSHSEGQDEPPLSKAKLFSSIFQDLGFPIRMKDGQSAYLNYKKLTTFCAVNFAVGKKRGTLSEIDVLSQLSHNLAVDAVKQYRRMTVEVPSGEIVRRVGITNKESLFNGMLTKHSDNIQDLTLLEFIERNYTDFIQDRNFIGIMQYMRSRRNDMSPGMREAFDKDMEILEDIDVESTGESYQ